jgi:7-carboxy-7-deazaguanine synthase
MLISEVFHAPQGEGVHSGEPSLFVRTSGCNLRCTWCDTPYTSWQPEGTARDILSLLDETDRWPQVRHIVITGGEPLIQRDLPDFIDGLRRRGDWFITVETAGTVYNDGVQPDFFSISPKLRNSNPGAEHADEREIHLRGNRFDEMPSFMHGEADYQMKFVVQDDDDTPELIAFIERFDIPRSKVFLMPEATNSEQLRARQPVVAQICEREGLNFSSRLQIEEWGNRRGT